MQSTKKRLAICALVLALVTLAIGGVAAWAVGNNAAGWVSGPGESEFSLTVSTAGNEYAEDMATADIVVDIYKVANAEKMSNFDTYQYTLTEAFTDKDGKNNRLLSEGLDGSDDAWQELAEIVATDAMLHSDGTISLEAGKITLEPGIYAVLPHGRAITDSLLARSATYTYTFSPSIVSVPTKGKLDGVAMTSNPGDWIDAEVNLKVSREMRFGSLQINKNVVDEELNVAAIKGDPATFEFNVTGTSPQGNPINLKASITIPVGESTGSVILQHIPAGSRVSVTESYYDYRRFALLEGPVYSVDMNDDGETITIIADDEGAPNVPKVSATFTNTYDNTTPSGGNGIQNNFTYDHDVTDWVWTPTPDNHAAQGENYPSENQ